MERINEFIKGDIKPPYLMYDFTEELNAYIERTEISNRSVGIFSASDLGAPGNSLCKNYTIGCGRKMFYRYLHAPLKQAPDAGNKIRTQIGTAVHEYIQDKLYALAKESKTFKNFRAEVTFTPKNNKLANELGLSTTTDGLYEYKGTNYVLEIKTIGGASFNQLNAPKKEHVTQAHVYCALADVPFCTLYYCSLGGMCPTKMFLVPFNPAHWKAIVDKINYVKMYAEKLKEPPREPNFYCGGCGYRYLCKPEIAKKAKNYRKKGFLK